ncbi:MAG: hypothetical protein AAF489_10930 [Bacteroidota bacterium]
MNIWKRIKQLSIGQLFKLGFVFAKRPLLIGPTLRATKRTMHICYTLYGGAHHKNGKANAFRHALWNILICQNCQKKTKNDKKSIIWTEKITILYEKVTKNEILDQHMDLHNNELGIKWFRANLFANEAEIISFIQKKLENAQKVAKIEEIENLENTLIYISE